LHIEATCIASHFAGQAEIVSSPLFEIARVLVRLDHVARFMEPAPEAKPPEDSEQKTT